MTSRTEFQTGASLKVLGSGGFISKFEENQFTLRSETTLRQALSAIQAGKSELMLPLRLLLRSSLSFTLNARRDAYAKFRRSVRGKIQIHHLLKFKLSCN